MVKSKDDRSFSVAPFLKKCYEMVDDESTDAIISWSRNGVNSFVIWDMTEFSVRLLPKYFKHSNFSSFVRQLNIYGFRKIDSDNWEFSNDGFVRGQKHLLKSITRRKNIQAVEPRKQENTPDFPGKLENSELWRQVEHLKADKNSLMQELIKLRQYQETADSKLLLLKDQLNGMEENQQQMLSFLVLVMQSPNLLVQLLKPNENNWRTPEDCQKKSGTIVEEINEEVEALPLNRSLVMYHRRLDETSISPEDCQDLDKDIFSSDAKMDFLKNIDRMKIFVDEFAQAPLITPDLYDDGAWEKLLLASPSRTRTMDGIVEGQRFGGEEEEEEGEETRESETMGMGTEFDKKRAFELLLQEMEKSDDDFEVENLDSEKSRNLQILTEQMGLLASNEQSF